MFSSYGYLEFFCKDSNSSTTTTTAANYRWTLRRTNSLSSSWRTKFNWNTFRQDCTKENRTLQNWSSKFLIFFNIFITFFAIRLVQVHINSIIKSNTLHFYLNKSTNTIDQNKHWTTNPNHYLPNKYLLLSIVSTFHFLFRFKGTCKYI